jgi:hypothetical protein
MAAVMAYTMLGGHSSLKCLLGAGVFVAGAVAMAPLARRLSSFRRHVLDYGAMALCTLALLPHHAIATGEHAHGAMPLSTVPVFVAVVAVWLGARAALAARDRDARGRASVLSATLTAAGLGLMLAFCS